MRLTEFNSDQTIGGIKVGAFLAGVRRNHRLAQMGGEKRFYKIGNTGKMGVIFLLDGTSTGLGVAWVRGQKTVETIYIWKRIDPDKLPDIAIDFPADANLDEVLDQVDKFIKSPRIGVMEAEEVELPADVPEPTANSKSAGKPVVTAPPADVSDDLVHRLIKKGEVVLMGRKAKGEYFIIPGMSGLIKKLDKMLDRHISEKSDGKSMEEQYANLEEKTRMVLGKSRFAKAMIITGAPSAGKSFRVMRVVKELGLKQGPDYVLKTGSVTDTALYRLFIEQIDGLIILDDCDSVWDSPNGANYLKGALNTDPVRSISKDSGRVTNVGAMTPEVRADWLQSASRVLRGKPIGDDLEKVYPKMNAKTDHSHEAYAAYLSEAQTHLSTYPPNQVDFRGRMIFISNLEKEQLDQAVLSRCVHVDLNFSDDEMLDFIETIGEKLERADADDGIVSLTPEQIAEVFTFVRWKVAADGFQSAINFRFIQKCFDFRRSSANNWKSLISEL